MSILTAVAGRSILVAIVGLLLVACVLLLCILILMSKESLAHIIQCGRGQPSSLEPRTFFDDIPLGSLKSGVRLRTFADGVLGFPIDSFMRLAVVKDNFELPIQRLDDLEDSVEIDSESKALEYVRLLTNSDTRHFFVDTSWTGEASSGVPTDDADAANAPIVRDEGTMYIVERSIVDKAGYVQQVVEEVHRNGKYRLNSK